MSNKKLPQAAGIEIDPKKMILKFTPTSKLHRIAIIHSSIAYMLIDNTDRAGQTEADGKVVFELLDQFTWINTCIAGKYTLSLKELPHDDSEESDWIMKEFELTEIEACLANQSLNAKKILAFENELKKIALFIINNPELKKMLAEFQEIMKRQEIEGSRAKELNDKQEEIILNIKASASELDEKVSANIQKLLTDLHNCAQAQINAQERIDNLLSRSDELLKAQEIEAERIKGLGEKAQSLVSELEQKLETINTLRFAAGSASGESVEALVKKGEAMLEKLDESDKNVAVEITNLADLRLQIEKLLPQMQEEYEAFKKLPRSADIIAMQDTVTAEVGAVVKLRQHAQTLISEAQAAHETHKTHKTAAHLPKKEKDELLKEVSEAAAKTAEEAAKKVADAIKPGMTPQEVMTMIENAIKNQSSAQARENDKGHAVAILNEHTTFTRWLFGRSLAAATSIIILLILLVALCVWICWPKTKVFDQPANIQPAITAPTDAITAAEPAPTTPVASASMPQKNKYRTVDLPAAGYEDQTTYSDTIKPGEIVVYRIRPGWAVAPNEIDKSLVSVWATRPPSAIANDGTQIVTEITASLCSQDEGPQKIKFCVGLLKG